MTNIVAAILQERLNISADAWRLLDDDTRQRESELLRLARKAAGEQQIEAKHVLMAKFELVSSESRAARQRRLGA